VQLGSILRGCKEHVLLECQAQHTEAAVHCSGIRDRDKGQIFSNRSRRRFPLNPVMFYMHLPHPPPVCRCMSVTGTPVVPVEPLCSFVSSGDKLCMHACCRWLVGCLSPTT
jgi:hypothetical protein